MNVEANQQGITGSARSYRTQLLKWGYTKYSTEAHPNPKRMRSGKNPVSHPVSTVSLDNAFVQSAMGGSSR